MVAPVTAPIGTAYGVLTTTVVPAIVLVDDGILHTADYVTRVSVRADSTNHYGLEDKYQVGGSSRFGGECFLQSLQIQDARGLRRLGLHTNGQCVHLTQVLDRWRFPKRAGVRNIRHLDQHLYARTHAYAVCQSTTNNHQNHPRPLWTKIDLSESPNIWSARVHCTIQKEVTKWLLR